MAQDKANEGKMHSEDTKSNNITFHYLKSPSFRVIHADGAYGGLTPSGYIHMALYSERGALPQMVEHAISPNGKLGDEIQRAGREGVVRELEVDAMFDENTARAILEWLTEKLEKLEEMKKIQKRA